MPVSRGVVPSKVTMQVDMKCNLGNFESCGFSVGFEVPGGSDLDSVRKMIETELYKTGKMFLAGYDLPNVGQKQAGQVALSLKKGAP